MPDLLYLYIEMRSNPRLKEALAKKIGKISNSR